MFELLDRGGDFFGLAGGISNHHLPYVLVCIVNEIFFNGTKKLFPQPRFFPLECPCFILPRTYRKARELPSINLPVTTPRPSETVLPVAGEIFPVLRNAAREKLSGGKYRAKPFLRFGNYTKTMLRSISDL
jgi:hypothetical protein